VFTILQLKLKLKSEGAPVACL